MRRSAATTVELFNELSGRFEKLEEEVKGSATKFIEGVWEDFLEELEAASGDAFELGLEGGNLQETFASLDRLVVQYRGRLEALAEELERRLSEELLRELGSKVEPAPEAFGQALRLLHVLYLHSGDEWFLYLAMLLYALHKSRHPDSIYAVAGLGRFLRNEPEGALALAAYAARGRLPRRPPAANPRENPKGWAKALELSYHYEIGMNVAAELMREWGIADALREPEWDARILLGTNILVGFALDAIRERLSEEERAAAARKLAPLSECELLTPEIASSAGFPRALSRAALEAMER